MRQALPEHIASVFRGADPVLIVLAGSNGAGKSTFHALYLRSLALPFINADNMAKLIHPADPASVAYDAMHAAEAARLNLFTARASFCMETVFSDPEGAKLAFLRQARAAGYRLLFLWIRISDATLSQARVRQRVIQGGHDVPPAKIVERFPRTQRNAGEALALANLGLVIDNSSDAAPYQLVETWIDGRRQAT